MVTHALRDFMSLFSKLFGRPRSEPEPPADPDEIIVRALTESGVDLTRAQQLHFFLYFPGAREARVALRDAQRVGYDGELLDPPSEQSDWMLLLQRRMVVTRESIKAERARLDELAAAHDGEFEGWDAARDE
jgi:hypothetical protein